MLQVCKQSLIDGANIQIIFENTILLLNYFNRFFLFPILRLLIHNPTMILIETFVVYIKKFRNLVVLYLDLNKFPNMMRQYNDTKQVKIGLLKLLKTPVFQLT